MSEENQGMVKDARLVEGKSFTEEVRPQTKDNVKTASLEEQLRKVCE